MQRILRTGRVAGFELLISPTTTGGSTGERRVASLSRQLHELVDPALHPYITRQHVSISLILDAAVLPTVLNRLIPDVEFAMLINKRGLSRPNEEDDTGKNKADSPPVQSANPGFTRRSFLARVGATGIVTSAGHLLHAAPIGEIQTTAAPPTANPQAVPMVLKVNGEEHRVRLEPRVTLLDALRENLQLFGTKKGCDHGQCGACTLHVNGRRVNSCLTFAVMHQGDEITTIEGLAKNGQLHPVQAAFLEHDGFQCGYCTPGQIMSAAALLSEPCGADDDSVRECMSGNICRCGAYPNIVAAVQTARRRA